LRGTQEPNSNTNDIVRRQEEPKEARRSLGGAQEALGGTFLFSLLM